MMMTFEGKIGKTCDFDPLLQLDGLYLVMKFK